MLVWPKMPVFTFFHYKFHGEVLGLLTQDGETAWCMNTFERLGMLTSVLNYKLEDWLTGIQVQDTFINCLNQELIARFMFNIFVNYLYKIIHSLVYLCRVKSFGFSTYNKQYHLFPGLNSNYFFLVLVVDRFKYIHDYWSCTVSRFEV